MKDIQLIIAHLLGGTSGLNLSKSMTRKEVREKVKAAFRVAQEICRQCDEFQAAQEIKRQEDDQWLRQEARKVGQQIAKDHIKEMKP